MKDAVLIGCSAKFRVVLDEIRMVSQVDSAVLIQGETGTGKEVVAKAIHNASPRARSRFVAINCAAIPSALLESELFGHERGAFTGAVTQRIGRFQEARGGTLFLDEIGDLPFELQPKLLRVLQEKQFERLGGSSSYQTDVRIITATNHKLERLVQEGKFRSDLYYRLNVFPMTLPPLRERKDDILLLIRHFVEGYARKTGKETKSFDKNTLDLLKTYEWPGNIRELQNIIERSVVVSTTETLSIDQRWLTSTPTGGKSQDGLSLLAERELQTIEAALLKSGGRISGPSGAATILGIPRQTLESKIKRLGLQTNRLRHFDPPMQALDASA